MHFVIPPNVQKEKGEEATVKPEAKSENVVPEKKAEAEMPTSVGKTESEKSVPEPKVPVSLFFLLNLRSFFFIVLEICFRVSYLVTSSPRTSCTVLIVGGGERMSKCDSKV